MYGMSEFLFSVASRDLEVEVFPSWLTLMNCPTLDRHFSNAVCDQFDLFHLQIRKLTECPHGDVIHRVMF